MDEKTIVFGNDSASTSSLMSVLSPMLSQRGIDPNLLLTMNNNGFGGNGNFFWVLFLLLLWNRNGFGGFGGNGNGCLAAQLNDNTGRELLMQAIQGNGNAIHELATNLNCSINAVQSAVNGVSTQILQVGNQVGMSGQQIINAIQAGNASIASQMASCCCDVRNSITTQGYENRIATLEQTNHLGGKIDSNTANLSARIDAQTTVINDKFCALEMREQQHTIDTQREEISTLKAQISNMQQTAMFSQMLGQATAPINAAIANLQNDVNGVKCKLPETVTVPAPTGVLVPSCAAWQMGLYGVTPFSNPGGFWG